ncbi:hypothetical protein GH714_029855 [Hevea brasiliensis]|uniref:Flavin-containing monooxygenase n=1 Tax=Hevea brasiliensis TaxID=3981 RepID=A0A6A6NJS5_HEVBR|nr:hypothetical protein GH714_029855 [Hevea brasiliensis]
MPTALISRGVAVIGAGAAGLTAARELHREGHKVVVFEREIQIGGIWAHDPRVESDPLSLDPSRTIVHSSIYSSLRTNLPREGMGFKEYPFIPKDDQTRDPTQVTGLLYLQDFAREYEIEDMVRLETEEYSFVVATELYSVFKASVLGQGSKCIATITVFRTSSKINVMSGVRVDCMVSHGVSSGVRVDACMLSGVASDRGLAINNLKNDIALMMLHKVVILIGSSISAAELCREIARVAKEVHVTARSFTDETYEQQLIICGFILWIDLPSKEEMMEDIEAFYLSLEASNIPKRYTHDMADSQFEYSNWLAAICGCEGFEEWRKQMFYTGITIKRLRPDTYRDEREDDDHLILEANQDFIKCTSKKNSLTVI